MFYFKPHDAPPQQKTWSLSRPSGNVRKNGESLENLTERHDPWEKPFIIGVIEPFFHLVIAL